jgi:hypothetical protein
MDTKDKFLSYPNKDPKTGELIKIGGKRYKELEEKYGTPKIKSPKTQSKIGVGKGEYKKLIKEGYTDDQLLYNVKKEVINVMDVKDNKIFNFNDAQLEIILKLTYPEIINYCHVDKFINTLCNDNKTWQLLIERDFPFLFNDISDSKETYKQYYNFFDNFITEILVKFLNYKTKLLNLDDVYQSLFKILTTYYNINSDIDLDDDAKNDYILQNTLQLNTILDIFKVLSIPIKRTFKPHQVNPPNNNSRKDDYDKMKYMSYIFSEMYDKWIDL